MRATCMVCAREIASGDNCGVHPRLLLAALYGEASGGRRERLQAAYLAAQAQASSEEKWDARRFKMGAVRALLPWRMGARGDIAEVMREELRETHLLAEAEIAALLGLSELRSLLSSFDQEEALLATVARRDLEIKASGGQEPSDLNFMAALEEFKKGVESKVDIAILSAQFRPRLESERPAVALMLHCEIIDTNGEMFEGAKAVKAAELAAILGLKELEEVVSLLSDQRYQQAVVTLSAAGVLARDAGGRQTSIVYGDEA